MSVSAQSDDKIDERHLELYPYCGKMFGYDMEGTSSRVVNSRESPKQYPWVVYLERVTKSKMNTDWIGACTGTVIAFKYV